MIYEQKGYKSATMYEVQAEPIEYLKANIQDIPERANLEAFKENKAVYFISGKMKSKDGKAQRGNENMIERDLIIIDIDDGEDYVAVSERLTLMGYEALIYPTPRHTEEKHRFRVVLLPDRPITSAESYKATMEEAAKELGIQFDASACTWAQLQGAPIRKKGAFEPIHLLGDPFPVMEAQAKQIEAQPITAPVQQPCPGAPRTAQEAPEKIPHEEALKIMKAYEKRDRASLKDRTIYLSALMTIIQAFQTNEIEFQTAEDCAVLLAGDNKAWQEGNRGHFRRELNKTIPRQEKSFRDKFDWQPSRAKAEDRQDDRKQTKEQKGDRNQSKEQTFDKNDIICLDDIEPKTVNWLWPGYIPFGMLCGIQGDPGSGKSYVTSKIAADLTRGIMPPDSSGNQGKTEPRNVVIVNGEDDLEHTIVPRLIAMNADMKRCFTMDERKNPLDFAQVERIENIVKQVKPALVIFDPIQAFLGRNVDMHRANEVRPVMARIGALAQQYNFACLFVGHMNKYGGGKAQYRGLGSIDFSAIYRTQFLVGDDRREKGAKLFIQIKNNLSPYEPAQGFRIESDKNITWTGPDESATAQDVLREASDRDGSKIKEASEWLLKTLEERPYYSRDLEEKASEAGIAKTTFHRARASLADAWKIESKKVPGLNRWYWAIKDKQVSALSGLSYEADDEEDENQLHQTTIEVD